VLFNERSEDWDGQQQERDDQQCPVEGHQSGKKPDARGRKQ
jgi:hypothetical protein